MRLHVYIKQIARPRCDCLDAVDLAENLEVEASDHLTTKVLLVLELLIEHGKDPFIEFGQVALDLLLLWLRLQVEFLCEEHATDALGNWADTLIEGCEELVALRQVSSHVHPVCVHGSLVTITNVHHLNHGRSINRVCSVLQYRNVHTWMRLDEVLCLVLAFEHIDFDVLEVQLVDQAVELEGTAICIQSKAYDIDFVLLDALDVSGPHITLLLAQ